MAYSETDRTWIRRYLGVGAIFLQAFSMVESAITATSSPPRPDFNSENIIKGLVYGVAAGTGVVAGVTVGPAAFDTSVVATPALDGLITIEFKIGQQAIFLGTSSVGKGAVVADPFRETIRLRSEGRRLAKELARNLGMTGVVHDIFSPSQSAQVSVREEDLFPASKNW